MEALLIPIVIGIYFTPLILSIIALVKVSSLRREVEQLRMHRPGPEAEPYRPPVAAAPPPAAAPVREAATAPVPPRPVAPSPPPQIAPVLQKPKTGVEFMMGGKAAAFAGIAILIIGIVLLVGYAVQNAWLGPGPRVILGLVSGGALLATGHLVSRRNERLLLFGRVVTGGGSALFYFSVYAAYGFYHLIGPVAAGAGLFGSALAVFGLAMAYRSQAVGVLGVLGAFVTPILIGADLEAGVFPMVYVAVVNVPVILLGVRRRWQVLYNLAYLFTILHYLLWVDWVSDSEFRAGVGFAILFYLEFAALGLLKLRSEQQVAGRTADLIRLISGSLLLMAAVYLLFDDAGMNRWIGSAFLLLALLHAGLAAFAFRVLTRFSGEILSFLAGGLFFAAMALPAQLDGAWVSLGWAIEGVIVAWFAGRIKSQLLLSGAFLLGLTGILKGLVFDVTLYDASPGLFRNARFAVGALSAVMLGVQGRFAGRIPEKAGQLKWQDLIWWAGVMAAVLIFFAEVFWSLGTDSAYGWLLTSLLLLVSGTAVLLLAPKHSSVILLGAVLLLLVPVKIFLVDALIALNAGGYEKVPFRNRVIWIQLVMLAVIILGVRPRMAARGVPVGWSLPKQDRLINIASLASGIGVVTVEMLRQQSDWAGTAVTVFWACCALALILYGMRRRVAAYRYSGLVLFGLTTVKVLFVDSSELKGLERIAAFIGSGVLLLALSFAYQKATAYFESLGESS